MDILIAGKDTYYAFELKGNFPDSTVWNTGEAGDINGCCYQQSESYAAASNGQKSDVEDSLGAKFGHVLSQNWTGDENEQFVDSENEAIVWSCSALTLGFFRVEWCLKF